MAQHSANVLLNRSVGAESFEMTYKSFAVPRKLILIDTFVRFLLIVGLKRCPYYH